MGDLRQRVDRRRASPLGPGRAQVCTRRGRCWPPGADLVKELPQRHRSPRGIRPALLSASRATRATEMAVAMWMKPVFAQLRARVGQCWRLRAWRLDEESEHRSQWQGYLKRIRFCFFTSWFAFVVVPPPRPPLLLRLLLLLLLLLFS